MRRPGNDGFAFKARPTPWLADWLAEGKSKKTTPEALRITPKLMARKPV